LNWAIEARVGDLFNGGGAAADGLDGCGDAGLVVASDVGLELAQHDTGGKITDPTLLRLKFKAMALERKFKMLTYSLMVT